MRTVVMCMTLFGAIIIIGFIYDADLGRLWLSAIMLNAIAYSVVKDLKKE